MFVNYIKNRTPQSPYFRKSQIRKKLFTKVIKFVEIIKINIIEVKLIILLITV